VKSAKQHPVTHEPLYDALASYAMGRDDGIASNGIGPKQTGIAPHGFSHMDRMSCAGCHSSWANNCIGCHLRGDYNTGNNFSNITGERIVYRQTNADFTYQTPVPFQLGVNADGKIAPISPNTEASTAGGTGTASSPRSRLSPTGMAAATTRSTRAIRR
jgi:hypothetical protein